MSITQSAYKMYATMLTERLREEVEEKGLLPSSQMEFRKGLGTIHNIYVLNYLINKYINSRKGKMVVLFVDLKAAFDSVDRRVFLEDMRKRDVREGLVKRCEEVLRETLCRVKVGEREEVRFWTGNGLRQGCPLSSGLFTILLADVD